MTRRLAIFGLALAALSLVATLRPARAATATANLTVQAVVLDACTIAAATLNFGNYDPTAAAATDAQGTVDIQCTSGSTYQLGLGLGLNSPGTTRRMNQMPVTTGEFLNYELYTDAGRTVVWDATSSPVQTATTAANGLSPYPATVYGRIAPGQNVAPGAYGDTVVMTLDF